MRNQAHTLIIASYDGVPFSEHLLAEGPYDDCVQWLREQSNRFLEMNEPMLIDEKTQRCMSFVL